MMSRSNQILLVFGVIQWIALCSLWKVLEFDQLYFISQALFIFSLSIVLVRQFKRLITEIIFFLSVNQLIDELTNQATHFRISEYITSALVIIYLLHRNVRKNRTNT